MVFHKRLVKSRGSIPRASTGGSEKRVGFRSRVLIGSESVSGAFLPSLFHNWPMVVAGRVSNGSGLVSWQGLPLEGTL